MASSVHTVFGDAHWTIYPDGSAYLQEHNLLLFADLHIGKGAIFRASGIAVPAGLHKDAMMRLEAALARNPEAQVVFLGDLFHGVQNAETQAFREVLKRAPQDHFTLVLGNHDFHAPDWEEINCVDRMELGPMILVHEPPGSDFDHNIPFDMDRADQPGHYYVAGHLHPAAALRGKGRSRLMLPAFYFGDKLAVLPAFGLFTGRKALDAHGRFYGLAENSIIDLGVNPSKG